MNFTFVPQIRDAAAPPAAIETEIESHEDYIWLQATCWQKLSSKRKFVDKLRQRQNNCHGRRLRQTRLKIVQNG